MWNSQADANAILNRAMSTADITGPGAESM